MSSQVPDERGGDFNESSRIISPVSWPADTGRSTKQHTDRQVIRHEYQGCITKKSTLDCSAAPAGGANSVKGFRTSECLAQCLYAHVRAF